MKITRKNNKQLIKFFIILAMIIIACVLSKKALLPVIRQLKQTKVSTIAIICVISLGYFVFEGINLWRLSLKYNPNFTLSQGVSCSFYACFYRTITMGSASFAAGMYYLNKKGVPLANTLSLITLQYISYKIAITLFCGICMTYDYEYMHRIYGDYFSYILLGFLLTLLIIVVLILICICSPLHKFLLFLCQKLNRNGTYNEKIATLSKELVSLRKGTYFLIKDKLAMVSLLLRNLTRLLFWYSLPCILFQANTWTKIRHTISIASLVTDLAGVIPSPAGIGSTEVLFTAFYSRIFGTTLAASSMLLYRFATFIFPFLVGISVIMCYDDKK
ncbi:MAG: lysylphosphatidylglycerol synthase domain-containing protein [Velocimicrobium sp.]